MEQPLPFTCPEVGVDLAAADRGPGPTFVFRISVTVRGSQDDDDDEGAVLSWCPSVHQAKRSECVFGQAISDL